MKIEFNVHEGPKAAYGFRSGQWPYAVNEEQRSIFLSVPDAADLATQEFLLGGAIWDTLTAEYYAAQPQDEEDDT